MTGHSEPGAQFITIQQVFSSVLCAKHGRWSLHSGADSLLFCSHAVTLIAG
jgi:hypothetical protein